MKYKTIFIFALLSVVLLLVSYFYFFNSDDKSLIRQGNEIVKKIEKYRLKEGRLPNALNDIGIEEKMEGPIYYTRWDSVNYILYFSIEGVGESMNYYSDTEEWSPIQRGIKEAY